MMLVLSQNVISFVALFDVWLAGASQQACTLIMKIKDKEREINTKDVTEEFYNGRPSPLKTPKRLKLLPEAPKHINVAYNYSHATATVFWTPGYQAIFIRYFLFKLVNDKEIDGSPMRYTRYLLHGPVPKLKKKTNYLFSYKCVNVTNTYKLGACVWSLGSVNIGSRPKVFWINEYSGKEVFFKPDREKVREGIRKPKTKICRCSSEITINQPNETNIILSVHNDFRRHKFEVRIVSTKGRVFKTMSFTSNPTKNVTRLPLKLYPRRQFNSKIQVFKICSRPETEKGCAVMETQTSHGSQQKFDMMTDYFAFL